ncbi:hypothetical protein LA080_005134 [Diaporthe eres]|nr:hypothetical protein LA080_005134 [Diaporthe eres]
MRTTHPAEPEQDQNRTRTGPEQDLQTWRPVADLAGLAGWRAGRQLDGTHGRDGHEEEEAPGGQAFSLAGGVEIGRTRQREVWPLTSMASNYSPSRGHPESPHTK